MITRATGNAIAVLAPAATAISGAPAGGVPALWWAGAGRMPRDDGPRAACERADHAKRRGGDAAAPHGGGRRRGPDAVGATPGGPAGAPGDQNAARLPRAALRRLLRGRGGLRRADRGGP